MADKYRLLLEVVLQYEREKRALLIRGEIVVFADKIIEAADQHSQEDLLSSIGTWILNEPKDPQKSLTVAATFAFQQRQFREMMKDRNEATRLTVILHMDGDMIVGAEVAVGNDYDTYHREQGREPVEVTVIGEWVIVEPIAFDEGFSFFIEGGHRRIKLH